MKSKKIYCLVGSREEANVKKHALSYYTNKKLAKAWLKHLEESYKKSGWKLAIKEIDTIQFKPEESPF